MGFQEIKCSLILKKLNWHLAQTHAHLAPRVAAQTALRSSRTVASKRSALGFDQRAQPCSPGGPIRRGALRCRGRAADLRRLGPAEMRTGTAAPRPATECARREPGLRGNPAPCSGPGAGAKPFPGDRARLREQSIPFTSQRPGK